MKSLVALTTLALLATLVAVSAAPTASAVCSGGDCFYTKGANVCWWEIGSNGNTDEICVGASGYWDCYTDFGHTTCSHIP